MTDWYKRQTPNNSGVWNELESTYNIDEAQYIIMQEETSLNSIDKNKTLFFGKEPHYIVKNRCPDCFRNFHFELYFVPLKQIKHYLLTIYFLDGAL